MAERKGTSLEIATQGFSSPDGLGIATQGFVEPILGDLILSGEGGVVRVLGYISEGGLVVSGDALLKAIFKNFGVGGLVTAGDGGIRRGWTYATAGGLVLGGAADVNTSIVPIVGGNLVLGGTADVLKIFKGSVVGAGGLVTGGFADFNTLRRYAGTGGLVTGGNADASSTFRAIVIGEGGLVTGGNGDGILIGGFRLGRGGAGVPRRRRPDIKYDQSKRYEPQKTPKDYWKKIEDALEKARNEKNTFMHDVTGGISLGPDSNIVVILHDLDGPTIQFDANIDAETMLRVESLFTEPEIKEVIDIEDQLFVDGIFDDAKRYNFTPGPKKRFRAAGGEATVKFTSGSGKATVEHFDKGLHRRRLEEEELLLGTSSYKKSDEEDELLLL